MPSHLTKAKVSGAAESSQLEHRLHREVGSVLTRLRRGAAFVFCGLQDRFLLISVPLEKCRSANLSEGITARPLLFKEFNETNIIAVRIAPGASRQQKEWPRYGRGSALRRGTIGKEDGGYAACVDGDSVVAKRRTLLVFADSALP